MDVNLSSQSQVNQRMALTILFSAYWPHYLGCCHLPTFPASSTNPFETHLCHSSSYTTAFILNVKNDRLQDWLSYLSHVLVTSLDFAQILQVIINDY